MKLKRVVQTLVCISILPSFLSCSDVAPPDLNSEDTELSETAEEAQSSSGGEIQIGDLMLRADHHASSYSQAAVVLFPWGEKAILGSQSDSNFKCGIISHDGRVPEKVKSRNVLKIFIEDENDKQTFNLDFPIGESLAEEMTSSSAFAREYHFKVKPVGKSRPVKVSTQYYNYFAEPLSNRTARERKRAECSVQLKLDGTQAKGLVKCKQMVFYDKKSGAVRGVMDGLIADFQCDRFERITQTW